MQSKEESSTFLKALLEESEELEKTLKEIEDGKGWVQFCEFFDLNSSTSLRCNLEVALSALPTKEELKGE